MTRRIGVSTALVLVVMALLAVLVVRSRAAAAAAADCGPLHAAPGAAVDGVSAVLHGLPAAVTTSQHITATMALTAAEPTTIEFAAGASADLVVVDDRGNVVGSGNYAHNAIGDTSHPVDEGDLVTPRVPIRVG